jgi:ribose transport system permease protein
MFIKAKLTGIINKIFKVKEIGVLIPLVIIFMITGLMNDNFFTLTNIINILFQSSFVLIIAVGMTFVLISGQIDLSVGSVLAIGGIVPGLLMINGVHYLIAIVVGLLLGILIGFITGIFVARLRIPAIIVTLAMLYIIRGLSEFLTLGEPVYPFPEEFNVIGQGKVTINSEGAGIPYGLIIAIVVTIIAHIILRYSIFGRSVYAVGADEEAARLSGINVKKITIVSFIIVSVLAAFSGILTASRVSSALNNAGVGWELIVIAACIIGGTSVFGGVGSILGTAIGAVLMTTVTNAMVMLKISVFLQKVVIGIIILFVVLIDQSNRSKVQK